MCIFEYNEEQHLRSVYSEGESAGLAEGVEIGETRFARLIQTLRSAGKSEDADRVIFDPEYRKQLYREYQLDLTP